MPYDISGAFSRVYDFETDRNNGIAILAARVDGEFDGVATGLSQAFVRDGRAPMTGDLRIGGYKLLNLGDGTVAAPAVNFNSETSSGLYRSGAGEVAISVLSTQRLKATNTGVTITGNAAVSGSLTVGGSSVALLASPAFTGVPTAPTAAVDTNTTQIATTAYVVGQGYAKLASPTFTGTPAAPTAAPGTNTTQLATTAFVAAAITAQNIAATYAPLASPTFTGTPAAPTPATADNTTQIATTAFVKAQAYAPLASPALTGSPTAPTPATADNSTLVATTAFVKAQNYALLASPAFTGTPTAPTAVAGTNTTQVATTAFVTTAVSNGRAPNIQTVASSATVTPTFSNDAVKITAQAAALNLANPTGTIVDMWGIAIRIKDNGTARAITYGTQYRAIGVTLPTTTVVGKTLYLGMVYNNEDTKWDVVSVQQEA